MNFQALHFSSEDEFDDSSVDSYESSDEEGDMVGGLFSRSKKKDPETESFLKKLFYYSHMDGENEVFLNEIDVNIYSVYQLVKKRNKMYIAIKQESQKEQKQYLRSQLKSLQEQIDDLQQTKKMEKFDIRILHYIDVLMQIKTCEENSSSFSRKEFDETNNKLNKDSLKWLYHEYITDGKERKIFYENILFHDASFNESAVDNTHIFDSMNDYYFLLFSCHDIDEEQGKYRNKIVGVMNKIKTIFKQLEKLSHSIKSKIKTIIDNKIAISYDTNSIQTRDAILSYIENSKKDIGPHDIQLNENSPTEDISRIQNQISNFLNNEYITNENNENSNNPMFTQNDLKTMESLDETIIQFWKDNQYENIPFDGNENNYPFLIRNERKHTFPRFSIVFDKDTYAENVKKWFELCHTYEFTPISAENTMGLTEQYYNGVNVRFAYDYEEYYPFEIRFHTLETFMMKEIPHYYLETLVEGIGAYEFNTEIKNGKKILIMVQNNPPEIIKPIINNIIGLFDNLKHEFESTDDNKAGKFKKNDDEMEKPIDFVNYITKDEQTLTKHQYKTILYFLIANQLEKDLKLALGKKKKSSEFVKFEDIYQDVYNDSLNDNNYLYDDILNVIFSNYLEYLKEKMYTYDVTNIIAKRLMQGDINYSTDTREFIQQPDISYLKSQLQQICNGNMILKHFIQNDSGIRFDIEESKTPPEEPFNPFPNLLGYELIVNDYMKFVMNRESVEAKPLKRGEVGEAKESETKQEDNEEEEEEEEEEEGEEGSETKNDKTQHTVNSKPPEQEYDVYFQHVNERVYELYKKMEATKDQGNNFKVTIASDDGNSCSLGTGYARTQWLAKGYRDEQYQAFITHLHDSLKGLKNKYKNRVVYGRVSGSGASATNYHVWGANSKNWDLPPEERIEGDGQAADMKTMGDGVFGIVTTPLFGKPELKNINNKDKIDKIIDELKELAKRNNSSAESGSSQTIPVAEGSGTQPSQNGDNEQQKSRVDGQQYKTVDINDKLTKIYEQQRKVNEALVNLTNRNDDTKKREKLNELLSNISEMILVKNIDDKIKAILETNNQIPPGIESISAKNSLFDANKPNETRPPSTTATPK